MSKSNIGELKKKFGKLQEFVFADKTIQAYEDEIKPNLVKAGDDTYYAAFLTVCDTKKRGRVFRGVALTLSGAIDEALQKASAGVVKEDIEPKWIKLEIVIQSQENEAQPLVDKLFRGNSFSFRKGIALDPKYNYAYTEAELNNFGLLDYKNKVIDLRTFNSYSMQRDDDVILSAPKTIFTFVTDQYFMDDRDEVYSLYNEGLETGRRIQPAMSQKDVLRVTNSGVRFLINQMHPDGKFDYGYYPLRHRLISGYNIMRHTSSIWSLVCAAEINRDKEIYRQAVLAIKYMLSQIKVYEDGVAYVIEKDTKEIKLGANGVAIIMLTQFMKLFDTREYVEICERLGRGILMMMNPEGGFFHVLNADDRSIKAEYRTVYYDGEATFALCRLYSLTGSKLWLMSATQSVDYFIEADYTQYRDHWIAYAVNELTMHVPEEKYFEFGLRNVQVNLEVIYNTSTTYHTYLEMLMATYEMYERMIQSGVEVEYLKEFDTHRFAETIMHRAERMLNGYAYPEYAMYFRKPNYFKGSFFVRHDAFRTRIDDVQHNCGSYISLYRHYDEIQKLLED